jgi:hypothetical protein
MLTPGCLVTLTEEHFTVKDLAKLWSMSEATVRRMFRNEPGVLRFRRPKKGHKRDYATLRIPRSVAERVYRRMTSSGAFELGFAANQKSA